MAWEEFIANRGYVWVKEESTYGSNPSLTVANVIYVEDWEAVHKPINRRRTGLSPKPSGWRPQYVDAEFSAKGKVEFPLVSVAGTDSITPSFEPILRATGWGPRVHAAGSPNTITYTLLGGNHGSCAFEEYFFDEAEADGKGWRLLGCRGDWVVNIVDGEPTFYEFDVMGMGNSAQITSGLTPSASADYPFGSERSAIGGKWTAAFTSIDNSTSFDGRIINATLRGNMNPQKQRGLNGTVGPQAVKCAPGAFECDLTVVQVADGDWDPEDRLDSASGDASAMTVTLTQSHGGDAAIFSFTAGFEDLEIIADEAGYRAWRLKHSNMYPEVSSDGGGVRPADNLTLQLTN